MTAGYTVQGTTDGGYAIAGLGYDSTMHEVFWFLKTDSKGDTIWTRIYHSIEPFIWSGNCMDQTADGGYILVGHIMDGHTGQDWALVMMKIDENGDSIWLRSYSRYAWDAGRSVQQTSDGGYIVTGLTQTTDTWLLKTDSLGDTLWTRTWNPEGICVQETSDRGYIVLGQGAGINLIKTDSAGNELWEKSYADSVIWYQGRCVRETNDAGYIVAGDAYWDDTGKADLFLIKTDPSGDSIWSRIYDLSETDVAYWVEQTADGGYIITGLTEPTDQKPDLWLLKTDANGDTLWTRIFGSNHWDCGYCVRQTADLGYVITGRSGGVLLAKTDQQGYLELSEQTLSPPEVYLVQAVGSRIVLRYSNHSQGFSACIYDASGRRVDVIQADEPSGVITWGNGFRPGVYFIREVTGRNQTAQKLVLIR